MPSTRRITLAPLYPSNADLSDKLSPNPDDDSSFSGSSGIPRPCNSFILFRRQYSQDHSKQAGTVTKNEEKSLSRRAGDAWRALSPAKKLLWEELAKKEKIEHARKYPDYRFRPIKRLGSKSSKAISTRRHSKSVSAIQQPLEAAPAPIVARAQSPSMPMLHRPVPRRATSDGTVNIVNGELRYPEDYSPPILFDPLPPLPLTPISPSSYYPQSYPTPPSLLSSPSDLSSPETPYSYPSSDWSTVPWISQASPVFDQYAPIGVPAPLALLPPAVDYQHLPYAWNAQYTNAKQLDSSVWDGVLDVDGYITQCLSAF